MDLRFHKKISPPNAASELISFDIDSSQEPITSWSNAAGKLSLLGNAESTPVELTVVQHHSDGDQQTKLKNFAIRFPTIQLLGNDFLVVGSRCWWTATQVERNAIQYDRNGNVVATATFGDGIAHIGTTSNGSTWVGYFDEGIFGNYGWGNPGPEPIGAYGINCFGPDLKLAFHEPEYGIADCYAMNVTDARTYACCYTDWLIRRYDAQGNSETWENEIAGASILLATENIIGLIGCYQEERDRVVTGELSDGKFRVTATKALTVNGSAINTRTKLAARGNVLHALIGNDLYKADLTSKQK